MRIINLITIIKTKNMSTLELTETETIQSVFDKQKQYQYTQKKTTAKERIALLRKLQAALPQFETKIIDALKKDLSRPEFESFLMEIGSLYSDIDLNCSNLEKWMEPEIRPSALNPKSSVEIVSEPRGVVLIIGPWNAPFLLVFQPLVVAIAAGNCAIVKPSEMTPHVSRVIAEVIEEVFAPEVVKVIEGGVPETTTLLELPFDHIFFTGSPAVGKIVMSAAAKNLTSVTLELGGKSPMIVDVDANLEKAAYTVMHKKTGNAGQVCICPDYLFIPKQREDEFLKLAKKAVDEMYYPGGKYNGADSTRIINKRNFDRLKGLFDDAVSRGAKVSMGGTFDEKNLKIEPTILTNVSPDSKIMQEEIFGPILPVLNYTDLAEVIAYVNKHNKPLGLYFFSNVKEHINMVVSQTTSGGVTINETEMQALDPTIPFGGVNNSGIGSYHGIYGFREFSHQKSVFYDNDAIVNKFAYPPFAGKFEKAKERGATLFEMPA